MQTVYWWSEGIMSERLAEREAAIGRNSSLVGSLTNEKASGVLEERRQDLQASHQVTSAQKSR